MKTIFFILLSTFFFQTVLAQGIVVDESKLLELTENQVVLLAALQQGENESEALKDIREEVAGKTTLIHAVQSRLYRSLSELPEGLAASQKVKNCAQAASDIYALQKEILELTQDNPSLSGVSLGLSWALAERTAAMAIALQQGVLGTGEENLLHAGQRLELLSHVENELRLMRGMCFQVRRRLKLLQRGKRSGAPLEFPDYDSRIVAQILAEKP